MSRIFVVAFCKWDRKLIKEECLCDLSVWYMSKYTTFCVQCCLWKNFWKNAWQFGRKMIKYQSYQVIAPHFRLWKTFLNFFQKTSKKGIDKGKEMWYNSQAVRKEAGAKNGHWKLNNKREVQSIASAKY